MSADKRTVTTDALETLGTIITPNEKRDAIHLAVENVVAKERLRPGDHVTADGCFVSPGRSSNAGTPADRGAVGIVDPFLDCTVSPGERFWLVIYPRQINSLRHVWTHPAFPDAPEVKEEKKEILFSYEFSEKWLIEWCSKHDCPSWPLVRATIEGHGDKQWDEEHYLHFDGQDAHDPIPPEFWVHVENVLGYKPKHTPSSFSCSC